MGAFAAEEWGGRWELLPVYATFAGLYLIGLGWTGVIRAALAVEEVETPVP
jgi:hypothetical protein